MTRKSVVKALQGRTEALSGRAVADLAGLPDKATIDALGWLHDPGVVVRIGHKYRATWALSDSPTALHPDPMGALEVLWRGQASIPGSTPTRGEAKAIPPSRIAS
jgi:hypothetical protein